jgi:signal-transduction protein with cAMP-binding, CBS, and nucleotidyltransferase domain
MSLSRGRRSIFWPGGNRNFRLCGAPGVRILSREDLIQTIRKHGIGAPVREAMHRDVEPVDSHEMLESVMGRLRDGKVRALPVIHHGQLVGILTMENIAEFLMIKTAVADRRRTAQNA